MATDKSASSSGKQTTDLHRYLLLSLSRVDGKEIILELGVVGNATSDDDDLDELLLFLRGDVEAVVVRDGQAALLNWLDLVGDRLPYASCVQRRVINSDNFYLRVALASSDAELPNDLCELRAVKYADEH